MVVNKLHIFLLIAIMCIAVESHRLRPLIWGGKVADRDQFPYYVSYRLNDPYDGAIHECGGSIISEKFVLLAGHCINRYRPISDYIVATQAYSRDEGQHHQVKNLYRPEYFDDHSLTNDIALLELAEPFQFSDQVQPIALNPNRINYTIQGIVPGLGESNDAGTELKFIYLTTITDEECRERFADKRVPLHEPETLCAFDENHSSTRPGDSGGPLVANNLQIGIVSSGYKVPVGYPDIFIRVSEFYTWIQNTINSNN